MNTRYTVLISCVDGSCLELITDNRSFACEFLLDHQHEGQSLGLTIETNDDEDIYRLLGADGVDTDPRSVVRSEKKTKERPT